MLTAASLPEWFRANFLHERKLAGLDTGWAGTADGQWRSAAERLIGTAVQLAVLRRCGSLYQHWSWLTELDTALAASAPTVSRAARVEKRRHGTCSARSWGRWASAWSAWRSSLAALVREALPRVALFLVLTVELSGIVTELVKALVDRPTVPRPWSMRCRRRSRRACAQRRGRHPGSAVLCLARAVRAGAPAAVLLGAVVIVLIGGPRGAQRASPLRRDGGLEPSATRISCCASCYSAAVSGQGSGRNTGSAR